MLLAVIVVRTGHCTLEAKWQRQCSIDKISVSQSHRWSLMCSCTSGCSEIWDHLFWSCHFSFSCWWSIEIPLGTGFDLDLLIWDAKIIFCKPLSLEDFIAAGRLQSSSWNEVRNYPTTDKDPYSATSIDHQEVVIRQSSGSDILLRDTLGKRPSFSCLFYSCFHCPLKLLSC